MSKKNKPDSRGFVYSTDPDFQFKHESGITETLPPFQQSLKVRLDAKQRAGKVVSLVEGFIGKEEDLQEIERKLKSFCGTGGSSKDGLIIIQGDQREKIMQWLLKNNFVKSKRV